MPEQARIDTLGAPHHIMVRGIEGQKIFRDNNDRDDSLTDLRKILPETSTHCELSVQRGERIVEEMGLGL